MVYSFSPFGYEGSLVQVEVDLRRGIPSVDIVGLADGCVKESRTRAIEAIKNSGFEFPQERVLIALSPADLKKEGKSFDLAIALAILAKSKEEKTLHSQDEKVLVIGELESNGSIRACRRITAALQTAVEKGIKYAIVPEEGFTASAVPDGILVAKAHDLAEAFNTLNHVDEDETHETYQNLIESQDKKKSKQDIVIEFDDEESKLDNIEDHNGLKYAMAVAVAGGHHIIAYGTPGCGKTLVLSCMHELLPKLLENEKDIVKRIFSIAGIKDGSIESRQVRAPHQSVTLESMCGGGASCPPGEISLAHNGVLFLDEAAEFRTSVLQMLRIPLENNMITLNRAGRHTTYPASFQLAMTMNPCPCGNYGNKDKICLCSEKSVEQYWMKVGGPLMAVFGIRYNCNKKDKCKHFTREELRAMIEKAWTVQYARQGKLNEKLNPEEIAKYVNISEASKNLLNKYSVRETFEILKVARTLADIKQDKPDNFVSEEYIEEALELFDELPFEYE